MVSHPTMGAWIEIVLKIPFVKKLLSRTPRWVRGLKFGFSFEPMNVAPVAPHDGCVD